MAGLIVVATQIEAKKLTINDEIEVIISGIGATSAALATQAQILKKQPSFIINAGIAGAFANKNVDIGEIIIADRAIYADLGAKDDEKFLSLKDLGLSIDPNDKNKFNILPVSPVSQALAQHIRAHFGPILTANTVTGSKNQTDEMISRWPSALAEAMEGAGVAHAAMLYQIPFFEIRAISNMVGPRDKSSWRIQEALEALSITLNQAISFIKDNL